MTAFKELAGRAAAERKAEALEIYHKKLHRRSGERVGDWCTRLTHQMRQEGAGPPAQGQGFMLWDRSGLSEAQAQLLTPPRSVSATTRPAGRRPSGGLRCSRSTTRNCTAAPANASGTGARGSGITW